eukprot:scaffold104874_cov57-Phaeocystis_antarctica.AAC.2
MRARCSCQRAGVELRIAGDESLERLDIVSGRRLNATTALKQQHTQREGGDEAWPLAYPHRWWLITGGGRVGEKRRARLVLPRERDRQADFRNGRPRRALV